MVLPSGPSIIRQATAGEARPPWSGVEPAAPGGIGFRPDPDENAAGMRAGARRVGSSAAPTTSRSALRKVVTRRSVPRTATPVRTRQLDRDLRDVASRAPIE